MVLKRPTRPARTNTKKDILFIIGESNAKVGSQEITGVTDKFDLGVQNEAEQRLTEFWKENILVISNTLFQQPKRLIYRWKLPDSQYWNQIDYVLCVTCSLLWSCLCVLVVQSCLTLCDLIDYNLPCSPVPGILQARILEWIAILFSRGSSWLRDWTQISYIAGRFFTISHQWSPNYDYYC